MEVISGEAYLTEPYVAKIKIGNEEKFFSYKDLILAIGSLPTELKSMPFDRKRIISSTEALMLQEVPKHLVVVGGGYIGLELGTAYAKFGAKVTILEGSDTILPYGPYAYKCSKTSFKGTWNHSYNECFSPRWRKYRR